MAAGIPETRRRLAAVLGAGMAGSSLPPAEDEGAALPPRNGP
jgi:hypothetical protein